MGADCLARLRSGPERDTVSTLTRTAEVNWYAVFRTSLRLIETLNKVVGRLAPSPTGALHLGNARTFLLAWLSIRQQRGTLILRMEDIDSPRVKPAARQSTLDDLRWLGLDWDYGPDVGGPHQPYTQTERVQIYLDELDALKARQCVYPCTCSRSEIARSASAPHESVDGPVYPGTCRGRESGDSRLWKPDEFAWRWRASDATIELDDSVRGRSSRNVARELGDFIVARGTGWPAYQLAVVVDDFLMGVTEVVRGDDLLSSTFRQIDILKHMSRPIPVYAHVPLIIGPDGRRLAKRHGDTRLSFFRELGIEPHAIVGFLAWTAGLIPALRPIEAHSLIGSVEWRHIRSQPTVFDLSKDLAILSQMRC